MPLLESLKDVNHYLNRKYILPLSLTLTVFAYTQNVYPQSSQGDLKERAKESYEEQDSKLNEELKKQEERSRSSYREATEHGLQKRVENYDGNPENLQRYYNRYDEPTEFCVRYAFEDNKIIKIIVKGKPIFKYCIFPLALMLTIISLSRRRKDGNPS